MGWPDDPCDSAAMMRQLHELGSPATTVSTGGRYFGLVTGGVLPPVVAAKWLADAWDENAALYVLSPVASKLEALCETWLIDLLGLPSGCMAGFVGGTSTATAVGLAAARHELLRRQGWDVNARGLFGAPPIRVVIGAEAHDTVFKALALLGLGRERVEVVPVDGAFGMWAAASPRLSHLVKGVERADSWSVDAHKTLNAPYDCGIILCRHPETMVAAMQNTGAYIVYSEKRGGMLGTPEMSRRGRGIELWATLKTLGRRGTAELVEGLCDRATQASEQLRKEAP